MNRRDFAVLACRLIAVFLLVESIFFFAYFLHSWLAFTLEPEGDSTIDWLDWANLAVLVVPTLSALFLLRYSEPIGARLAPAGEDAVTSNAAPGAWLPFGLVLIGVLELVRSVPQLLNFIAHAFSPAPDVFPVPLVDRFGTGLITSSLHVALALWLVLGSRGLARMIAGVRGAGLQPGEQPWLHEPR